MLNFVVIAFDNCNGRTENQRTKYIYIYSPPDWISAGKENQNGFTVSMFRKFRSLYYYFCSLFWFNRINEMVKLRCEFLFLYFLPRVIWLIAFFISSHVSHSRIHSVKYSFHSVILARCGIEKLSTFSPSLHAVFLSPSVWIHTKCPIKFLKCIFLIRNAIGVS